MGDYLEEGEKSVTITMVYSTNIDEHIDFWESVYGIKISEAKKVKDLFIYEITGLENDVYRFKKLIRGRETTRDKSVVKKCTVGKDARCVGMTIEEAEKNSVITIIPTTDDRTIEVNHDYTVIGDSVSIEIFLSPDPDAKYNH